MNTHAPYIWGRVGRRLGGEKRLQVRRDVGWSEENELINGKVHLILLENTRDF